MQFHRPPAIYPASVQLKATDLKRSLEFYQEIVGFKVFEESSSHANLGADGKTAILSLVNPKMWFPSKAGPQASTTSPCACLSGPISGCL